MANCRMTVIWGLHAVSFLLLAIYGARGAPEGKKGAWYIFVWPVTSFSIISFAYTLPSYVAGACAETGEATSAPGGRHRR